MEKQILIDLINKTYSIAKIANELDKSKTSIRYWLNKYELKTVRAEGILNNEERICPNCKTEKQITEFYERRDKLGSSTYCKTCTKDVSKLRQQTVKQKCIEYKGDKCEICNYNKCQGALEFHHIDPTKKDFTIAHKSHSFNDLIKQELDKCILVCANCHREIHAELI